MRIAQLLNQARADVNSGWLPACQVAVARRGELQAFETFGDATNSTRFLAFSCTKPIVASAVWLLIGDGLLDVSLPVAHYVPEFGANGKEHVTVEQVMVHTAGFPNARIRPGAGADPTRRLANLARWTLEWEPGSRFVYHAESAHWVLAELLSRLGGGDFRDVIEQRVCAPLGLPRVLGLPIEQQHDIAPLTTVGAAVGTSPPELVVGSPEVIAAGIPGGGGVMTAADLAMFYQGVMLNPDELWRPEVLADVTANIRCRLPDPLFDVPVNRTLGLVVAGDDGKQILRYAGFGRSCSAGSFGHAGMHMQVGWGDPESGISFAYLTNGVDSDLMAEGARGIGLAGMAAALA